MELKFQNIPEVFEQTAKKYPKNIFLQMKKDDKYIKYTYEETLNLVQALSGNLSKIIKPHEKIAIISENRPEWCMAYIGIVSIGCTAVPLDTNLTEEDIKLFLDHSDSVAVFASGSFLEKVESIKTSSRKLKHIISFDEGENKNIIAFESLMKGNIKFDIKDLAKNEDIASLIYTSGTSGHPKAVMLTHSNLLHDLSAGSKQVNVDHNDYFIVLLPLHHIFAFTTIFLFGSSVGASLTFVRSLKKNEILETIKETKTTVIFGVPKIFESIYNGIVAKISEKKNTKFLVKTLTLANNTSIRLFRKNLGKVLFKEIHNQIGDTIKLMVSGGAAISKDVLTGMYLLGFPIVEGYGLTETSPVVSVNDLGIKFGSVGRPLEGIELRIIDKNEDDIGEIIIKGPTVMKGYYKNEELTKKAIINGWLHTKDLGYKDNDGYLYIKGRKDNMIVLPSGKNVYPEDVEHHYSKSPIIKEICVLGVRPKDLKHDVVHGLIIPNFEELDKRGINDYYNAIKEEIETFSKGIPTYKRIMSFDIVDEASLPRTSTLKFKKFVIKEKLESIKMPEKRNETNANGVHDSVLKNLRRFSKNDSFDLNSHLELDLKLDSLAIAEVVSNVEEECGIKVPYDLNPNISTVGDLVDLLVKHSGNKRIAERKTDSFAISDNEDVLVPKRTEYDEKSAIERVEWLRKKLGVNLNHLAGNKIPIESLKGNIEHYVGMSQIPTGIAGPLKINGEHAKGIFYVPLATTEGALVASANRGMYVITKSGGANARVISEQMTKAPIFTFKNGEEALKFGKWVESNYTKIKESAESTTKFGKLLNIEKFLIGRRLILKMCYSCGDAMGANMITMATQKACEFIKENYPVEDCVLQSNLEGEKKVSYMNFFSGRGKRAYADAVIKKELVEKYLHTSVDRIISVAQNSNYGSMMSGMVGTNAHIANMITAIFIATGQDVAHVHDSSIGITTMDRTKENDLYISVNLPSLAIGTIGGGTGIGTQKECLEILGCSGSGKVNRLAEIIAATALAGDLSLAGSQSAGDFASAHDKLGRNRPSGKKS